MRDRRFALKRSGFVRAVGLLVGGASFAHAITAAALPIVTRLYTPQDFSVLAVFTGVVATVAVAACLRFDVAIPMPEDDREAINVLALALLSATAISVLLGVALAVLPSSFIANFAGRALAPFVWLIPLAVFLAGTFSALQNWFVRRKGFAAIAATRIGQSTAASGTQVALGLLAAGPIGLVLGQTLNSGAGSVGFVVQFLRRDRGLIRMVDLEALKSAWSRYDRFPKLSALEALFNSAGIQIPIIMIAALAAGPEAGYVGLAMFVMQAPMGLIGSAISQVYLSRAPEADRSGRLGSLTGSVLSGLMKSGVGPLVFAGIVAPAVFQIIFGDEWRRAGHLVAWMTPWFVLQFLTAPISMVLHVKGRQDVALLLQFAGLALRVAAVYVMAFAGAAYVAEAYSISGFVFYAIYLAVAVRISGMSAREFRLQLRGSLAAVLGWAVVGVCFALLVNVVLRMLTR